ncbi:hypothetical protein ACT8ZV_07160 [Nocardioides sp. MAHUQ-72]|uniref:hypothetical protein n=1 Tax=unclassified Nocardioides TaxID=2615069 RepID=UPI00360C853B
MTEPGGSHGSGEVFRRALPQPDRRSCGAASLVVARMLGDSPYAGSVLGRGSFAAEVLALHRRLTSGLDARGRLQLPWPRALGTPPWAVARHLAALTGSRHRARWARTGRAATADRVLDLAAGGRPVVVYVGSRWLPRHVVLVVGREGDGLAVYEPASGRLVAVSRSALASGPLDLGGWATPWFSVEPRARRTPA